MGHDLEVNKQNAIAFYRTAYLGDPTRAVEDYVGAEYIQHNPLVADGKQAFIDYFNEMARDYPAKSIEFVRAVAIVSLGIISLTLIRGSDGMKNFRAVFFALGAGCLIAVYTVVDGLGARLSGSPHGYIFWYLALDTIPLAAFVLWWRRGSALKEIRRSWRVGVIASSMVVVSIWIITWALTLAPLALVSALRESSIVFAALFGVVFLKEKLDLNRLAAITMTLTGTILLKTSR